MKSGEREELERQGAKAAVRGDALRSNPLLLLTNMPPSTGECMQEWSSRRAAWEAGYEQQRHTPQSGSAVGP